MIAKKELANRWLNKRKGIRSSGIAKKRKGKLRLLMALDIKKAIKKPGSLRKSLGIKKGKKIPAKVLAKAAKKPGKMGQRARFAQTLKGFKNHEESIKAKSKIHLTGKLPSKVRNKMGFKKRWQSKIMKNFLCWPLEIIRTAYTKLVDKVFGKRCKCVNILFLKKELLLSDYSGKVLNNG